ncbi:hypothetical protein CHUAL_000553 [Chamberlinius hualienensis]
MPNYIIDSLSASVIAGNSRGVQIYHLIFVTDTPKSSSNYSKSNNQVSSEVAIKKAIDKALSG